MPTQKIERNEVEEKRDKYRRRGGMTVQRGGDEVKEDDN